MFYSLDENFDLTKETKPDDTVNPAANDRCLVLEDIPILEEHKSVIIFLEKAQKPKRKIIDLLEDFCVCVTKLNSFRWTNELSNIFKDVYQAVR